MAFVQQQINVLLHYKWFVDYEATQLSRPLYDILAGGSYPDIVQ